MKSPDSRYYIEVRCAHGSVKGHVKVDDAVETLTKFGPLHKLFVMKFIKGSSLYK